MADKLKCDRAKRNILRNIATDKASIMQLFEETPTSDVANEITAYVESWEKGLIELKAVDSQLLDLIDDSKPHDEILKLEVAIVKDYNSSKQEMNVVVGKLKALINRVNPPQSPSRQRVSMLSSLFLEATLTDPLIRIQDIPVPKFDGKCKNYPDWYNEFNSIINQNGDLSNFQKMFLLKRAMVDNAEFLMKDESTDEANYPKLMKDIHDRYFNKRIIISQHFTDLVDLPAIKLPSLRESLDRINRSIRGLKVCDIDTPKMSPLICFLIARKLPEKLRIDWENSNHNYSTYPSFETMSTFLSNRCFAYKTSNQAESSPTSSKPKPATTPKSSADTNAKPKSSFIVSESKSNSSRTSSDSNKSSYTIQCQSCCKNHYISACPTFLEKNTSDRYNFVKMKQLWVNCLHSGHMTKDCQLSKCRKCSKLHHTLLHRDNEQQSSSPTPSIAKSNEAVDNNASLTLSTPAAKVSVVLLPNAVININIGDKRIAARVLLDQCSQVHLIAEKFVRNQRLSTRSSPSRIDGVSPHSYESAGEVSLIIGSRINHYQISINAKIVGRIPYEVNPYVIRYVQTAKPELHLADQGYSSNAVDILIGGEYTNKILLGNKQFVNDLCFEESQLGWVVGGPTKLATQIDQSCCHLTTIVQDHLAKFWQIEEVDPPKVSYSDQELCNSHFVDTYQRLPNGRFQIRLPFKEDPTKLANTYRQARAALVKYENNPDTNLRSLYVNFMKEYRDLNHMRLVDCHTNLRYYIPHLPVLKPDSTTTKMRVVFNASAKNSSGISLNQSLRQGPNLQPDAFDIFISFRLYIIAFMADICKMYRQIAIHHDDQCYQTILWRDDVNHSIDLYELTTLTYGTTPASFVAQKCLQIISEELRNLPASTISEIITSIVTYAEEEIGTPSH